MALPVHKTHLHFKIYVHTVLGISNVVWWLMTSHTDWECRGAEFQHKMDHLDTETDSEYKSLQF